MTDDLRTFQYAATLNRVIDGDTVILNVDLGFHLTGALTFRLRGVNTPERGEPGWGEAKAYLEQRLTGKPLGIRTHKGQTFARWLADVYVDGRNLADDIVTDGYGVRYRA